MNVVGANRDLLRGWVAFGASDFQVEASRVSDDYIGARPQRATFAGIDAARLRLATPNHPAGHPESGSGWRLRMQRWCGVWGSGHPGHPESIERLCVCVPLLPIYFSIYFG